MSGFFYAVGDFEVKGELVSVLTSDKVRLDGFHCSPDATSNQDIEIPIDGVVLVHGLSGNFYQSRLLKHFAKILLNFGTHTVLVNTRGHDYLNATPRMGRTTTFGAAVEIVGECQYDLEAWAQYLESHGCESIMLLGHSLGAIKSLYAQAHLPHSKVSHIAAFSATKLSSDSLKSSSRGERFSHWLQQAKSLCDSGNDEQFLYVDFPFPTWMSARAYLAKYGDNNKYNWLSYMHKIEIPTLAAFGSIEMEENPSFQVM
ncbi:MAG: alpha/beta fold hydrolase, partial [Planctomycetota bacterium]